MTQEALRMALEAMESVTVECNNFHHPKRDQNHHWAKCPPVVRWDKAITAIKEALAQPEQFCDANCVWTDHHPDCKLAQLKQEPHALQGLAAYLRCEAGGVFVGSPSHDALLQWAREVDAAKAQRTWVGLFDDEIMQIWGGIIKYAPSEVRIKYFARAIESKLKEKNT